MYIYIYIHIHQLFRRQSLITYLRGRIPSWTYTFVDYVEDSRGHIPSWIIYDTGMDYLELVHLYTVDLVLCRDCKH